MNSLAVIGSRGHVSRELFPTRFKRGRKRRYTFLPSRVRAASIHDLGSFDKTQSLLQCLKFHGKSATEALEQYSPPRGVNSYSASSRNTGSPSYVSWVGGYGKASFSTFPYHRRPNNHVDLNGNGTGETSRAGELDFTRISSLIESDSGVVSSSSIWYVVATAALLGFNKQSMIEQLWKYISDQCGRDESRLLAVARRVRESCLKSSVLVGFPHGINGLLSLQSSIEKHSPSITSILSSDKSLRAPLTPDEKYTRGKDFFSSIYSKHMNRVLASMGSSSGGDLDYYAISSVYGELMAETSILGATETGILEFVCCLVCDVAPQAKGHFYGCKNLGATGIQMRGVLALVHELATQLDLPPDRIPGQGDRYGFLTKAEDWQ